MARTTALLLASAGLASAAPPLLRDAFRNPLCPEHTQPGLPGTNYIGLTFLGGFTTTNTAGPTVVSGGQTNLWLKDTAIGVPLVGIQANFNIGEPLTPPDSADLTVAPLLDFLGGPECAVWIDYERILVATDMGVVQATWTVPGGGTQTIIYTLSPNPAKRPVRLYWTEGQNAGPRIILGSNYRADLYYNSQIGSNDVWIADNLIHADQGAKGRILLTYSRLDEDTGKRRLLAHEIVDVREPMSTLLTAHVGDRLLPKARPFDISGLFPEVTRGAVDPSGQDTPYVYIHSQGARDGWVWAIRETAAPWQIEIYWKAKEELDVLWPFEVAIYDVAWNAEAQLYVRGNTAAGEVEPRIPLPSGMTVEALPHQKPPNHAVVADGFFHTTAEGYALLKLQRNEDIWFEPVRSIARTHPLVSPADVHPWSIPEALRPRRAGVTAQAIEQTHGDWPGWLAAGTVYNPTRYRYPDAYVAPADAASWLFPVNRGELEVWWSNPIAQADLPTPLYFPSLVTRYACEWPARAPEIVIASGLGSQGLTLDESAGRAIAFDRAGLSLEMAQLHGAHLVLANPNSLSFRREVTLEIWIQPANIAGVQTLVTKGGNYRLRLVAGVPEFRARGAWHGMGQALTPGVWQHLAVTLDERGDLVFLLDGQTVRRIETGTTGLIVDDAPLRIGARADGGQPPEDFFSGRLDEIRIWSVARSREDIASYRQQRVDGGAPGLRACYIFEPDERAQTGIVSDHSAFANHLPLPSKGVAFAEPGVRQSEPGVDLSGLNLSLYVQNARAEPGFNPNEEHAIIIQRIVYALRNDLNVTDPASPDYTSDPFVLLDAQTPDLYDGRPFMRAFRVVASNELYRFRRDWTAGTMIQPPAPIAMMPPHCAANTQVAGPEYRDRKGDYWAKQAGDDGGTVDYVFHYYYPMQTGFYFPGESAPPLGTELPWLDRLSGTGAPIDFTFTVEWPRDLPLLFIGDTLTLPRAGLPAIRGQLSVDVAYQQSLAHDPLKPSVVLIDPTRSRRRPLEEIPPGMSVYRDVRTGRWHFNDLPPALRNRLSFDPNAAQGEELQLIGAYITRTDGFNYLQLNVLTGENRVACLDPDRVKGIAGTAGDAWRQAIGALPTEPFVLGDDVTPFDSLALPTTGLGAGYVTVVFNNSVNEGMVDPSENVGMAVFRVAPTLFVGRLDVVQSPNPLDSMIGLLYTADFQGKPERFEFKWEWADPVNGRAPDHDSLWNDYLTGAGRHGVTIGDAGVFGLSDHYLRCAYRALDPDVRAVVGDGWAAWTPAVLCEGWIKRVLKAINPFDQRIRDFMNYEAETALSMLAQIGPPFSGDVPLNLDALAENGLMAIYETIARRAETLSIESDFIASDALALALLMVRGRLADMYLLLGHEAYGDALNPTVLLSGEDPLQDMLIAGDQAALFSFQNQVPNLLHEELALLRGRNASMNPPVTTYPVYNRLPWNLTHDIVGGHVAYVLNYGICDTKGNQNGVLDPGDAMALFPQGHGDAYGHYLSAIKGYYRYLHHPNFAWMPQVEGILVDDLEVTVSYLHEKKFAAAAAARARTAAAVIDRTWRADHTGTNAWQHVRDPDPERAWGVADWGSRGGMGAYFDWLSVNSLLPAADENPEHDGIRVIDRRNTPELADLATLGQTIQRQVDIAEAGLNPLGVAPNAVPFDISPADLDAGLTHFEQIYERALAALHNAAAVAARVTTCAQAIRAQNENPDLTLSIQEDEAAIRRRLIELYGHPYADDIGPGKLYAEGYTGPDLVHYMYVDTWPIDPAIETSERTLDLEWTLYDYETRSERVSLSASQSFVSQWFSSDNKSTSFDIVSAYYVADETVTVRMNVANNGIPRKPANYTGRRRAEGEIQIALSEYLAAVGDVYSAVGNAQYAADELHRQGGLWLETQGYLVDRLDETAGATHETRILKGAIATIEGVLKMAGAIDDMQSQIMQATEHALPKIVGLAVDPSAPARGVIRYTYSTVSIPRLIAGVALHGAIAAMQLRIDDLAYALERDLLALDIQEQARQSGAALMSLMQLQGNSLSDVQSALQRAETARMLLMARISEGDQLQIERERLRLNWAAALGAARYRNMAYRLFLNEELARREEAFGMAARYVYLAAKAYDYETGLLETDGEAKPASAFLRQIGQSRTLGRFADWTRTNIGEPLPGGAVGEPGLADAMARMKANWDVLKGRLNFNNPQAETGRFSLRTELFRLSPDAAGDESWTAMLKRHRVDNLRDLPEFRHFCLPFDPMRDREPALVIPFPTTIQFSKNVFGRVLAAGDNAYDSSHFATKIRSVGVWFSNYNLAAGGGLANQPRVYLFPAGTDRMRVPLGPHGVVRRWSVVDQALPLPYPLNDLDWEQPDWSVLDTLLGGGFQRIRRYPSLRAYHDAGDEDSLLDVSWNTRLVGRSVWNTRWVLIIPGGTLLADPDEGLKRFIEGAPAPGGGRDGNGVKDIKLYFHTYSYSGN